MTSEIVRAIARTEAQRELSFDSVGQELQTTDATVTVLITINTEDFEGGLIEYMVIARHEDGETDLAIKRIFSYVNNSVTLTISSETTIINTNNITGVVAANVNGMTIEIKVTGVAATAINWKGSYKQFNQISGVAL